mgnify:CR=1 FL=1
MPMGNLLRGDGVRGGEMATSDRETARVGLDHPTVVPTNFEPPSDPDGAEGADDAADADDPADTDDPARE